MKRFFTKALPDAPIRHDLVLIGGGHAHAMVLRQWGMAPRPDIRLTLINPGPKAPYSGMLPGHVAGHYSRADLDIDLVHLARFAGARLVLGAATHIDPQARRITVAGHGEIAYDVASVDIGIHARMPEIAGFAEHGVAVKPLDQFAMRWRAFLQAVAAGRVAPDVAVIGGGVAGLELVLAMAHALRARVGDAARIHVLDAAGQIAIRNPHAARRLERALAALGVGLRNGVQISRITPEAVILADGEGIPATLTVGAAGARAHDWLRQTALPLTEDGFIRVDRHLQVEGCPGLFAVGDCAHLTHAPRPKAGVFAVRAGRVLMHNLRAACSAEARTGQALRPYWPQRDYLKLISLGGRSAMAEKWGRSLSGPLLWRLKDRIDTGFMRKFRALPVMDAGAQVGFWAGSEDPLDQPLCGGCGAKLGPAALTQALAGLPAPSRPDLLSLPGDDAAVLKIGGQRQVITTDHLRAFWADPALMARIAAVHTLGDVWAMGAQPQAALASIILPRMADHLQARSLQEIMQAVSDVFAQAGAGLVGGHSTMGAEMVLGFTVTGLLGERPAITLQGARPGDCLILTRPLGSGTLLAAAMQDRADGDDLAAMLAVMAQLQGDAAAVLCDAHAMTDVTGFGLAGHLAAMCRASGVGAVIALEDVPLYPGALALAEQGVRSSLWAANRAAAPVTGVPVTGVPVTGERGTGERGARGALLHDPQTSGGLLAAVAAEHAADSLARLRALGHDAAIIGAIEPAESGLRCHEAVSAR